MVLKLKISDCLVYYNIVIKMFIIKTLDEYYHNKPIYLKFEYKTYFTRLYISLFEYIFNESLW